MSTTEKSKVQGDEKESGKEQINTSKTVINRQKRNAGTIILKMEKRGNQVSVSQTIHLMQQVGRFIFEDELLEQVRECLKNHFQRSS